jgi:dephospho-CoA kinase
MGYKNLTILGLTGNIACGKSTVVAILRELGAHTIDADAVTHMLQQPGQAVYAQIVAAFGEAILLAPQGPINRKALGAIVFRDPQELRRLEQIVHPAVRAHVWQWLDSLAMEAPARENPTQVAVIDAIKLIESGWPAICDSLWVVTCTVEQQIQRLISTRGMSETEAHQRIAAQSPQSEKIAHANVVIDNSGTHEETHQQVEAAWRMLIG